MKRDWMGRITMLNKTRSVFSSGKFLGFLPADVITSTHHILEKLETKPNPMPHYCCTGMTMKEWEQTKRE